MADDDDTKRVNVLIPRDLYERFLEFSKGEYKSTTGMIVEWMSTFVREKEREAQDKQAFLLAFSKFGQLLFNLGSSKAVGEEAG